MISMVKIAQKILIWLFKINTFGTGAWDTHTSKFQWGTCFSLLSRDRPIYWPSRYNQPIFGFCWYISIGLSRC